MDTDEFYIHNQNESNTLENFRFIENTESNIIEGHKSEIPKKSQVLDYVYKTRSNKSVFGSCVKTTVNSPLNSQGNISAYSTINKTNVTNTSMIDTIISNKDLAWENW